MSADRVIVLTWPAEPERGPEVVGPFTEVDADAWCELVTQHLPEAHFLITRLDSPAPLFAQAMSARLNP